MDAQETSAQVPERITLNSAADPMDAVGEYFRGQDDAADSTSAPSAAEDPPQADAQAVEGASVEAAPEAPKVDEPKPPDPAESLHAKLERLAQHEQRLRAERQQAKAERQQYQAELAKIQEFNAGMERLKGNPLELAKFMQVDVRDLIRASLGEQPAPKTKEEILDEKLAKIDSWEAQQEQAVKDAEKARIKAEEDAALMRVHSEAERGIREAGDEFELINAKGDYERVVATQLEYYRIHEHAIDWRTAARYVEEDLEKEGRVLAATKKLSAGFAPATAAQKPSSAPAAATQPPQAIPGSMTLTTRPVSRPTVDAPERVLLNTDSYLDRDESLEQLAQQLAAANRSRR